MNDGRYLVLMGIGYIVSATIETGVLLLALSDRHSTRVRIFAGLWLTACTYPIVWLFLPQLIDPETDRPLYLVVAEVFAPVAECLLFWVAFIRPAEQREPIDDRRNRRAGRRDLFAIVVANLASFGFGSLMQVAGIWIDIQRAIGIRG